MKKFKRLLSIALAIAIMVCAVPLGTFTFTANAETEYTEGYYTFTMSENNEVTIIDCDNSITGNITIPSHLGGQFPVVCIAKEAFDYCEWLSSVTISGNVKTIGNTAFKNCTRLESVKIEDPVQCVGNGAFRGCTALKNITIGDSVKEIYPEAFSDTAYYKNSKNWENDVLYIGKHLIKADSSKTGKYEIKSGTRNVAWKAFEDCSGITELVIPNSVKSIGWAALYECNGLKKITLPFSGSGIDDTDNACFSHVFGGTNHFDNSDYVPATLKEIVLTGSTSIGEWAFADCKTVESIILPNTIKNIGNYAFYDCYALKSITIPSSVKSIGKMAFRGCYALNNVTIKNGVTSIGDSAFYDCGSLTSITVPNSVTSMGSGVFRFCDSMKKITLPFVGSDLKNPASTQFDYIFSEVPDSLKEVVITNATTIGDFAFGGCENIESITIPSSVKSIGNYAFRDCTGLKKVNITDLAAWCTIDFGYNSSNNPLYYAKNLYINNTLATSITIPKTVKNISWHAFTNCQSLTDVVILNGVEIGNHVFSNCSNLKTVTLPASVNTMIDSAFYGCNNLKSVFYHGTKTEASKISFNNYNESIKNAKWYYSTCNGKTTHTYKTTITKATLSKNGSATKKCTVCGKTSKSTIKYAKTFKLSATSYTYNGKVKTPTVTVKDSAGNKLKKNVDYTLTSSSGRKNVGTYKVTIKLKGKYSGTKTLTFKINPPKTTVSKLTAGKKSITVNISKKSTQVSGYQVQYSTSKKFTSAKTKTVSSYKTTKVALKSLSAKKTYYVRVRTYKTVGGKKYYSGWSTVKSVKTK